MKSFSCALNGHKLYVSRHITYHVKEYSCQNCSARLTTASNGTLVPLTAQRQEVNAVLERIYKKRRKRRLKETCAAS